MLRAALLRARLYRLAGPVLVAVAQLTACRRSPATPLPEAASPLEAVPRAALRFTEGEPVSASEPMRVEAGGVRAVVTAGSGHAGSAELAFSFRGPSAFDAPLANGELRRQVGLKLRAQDTCNVVYVMWHVAPKPGVAVSVKRNAGRSTHAACGDGGYLNLTSDPGVARAPLVTASDVPGLSHVLHADLEGRALRVTADGIVVWRGELPAVALEFDGPAGFRTDNGTFDVELRLPNGRAITR